MSYGAELHSGRRLFLPNQSWKIHNPKKLGRRCCRSRGYNNRRFWVSSAFKCPKLVCSTLIWGSPRFPHEFHGLAGKGKAQLKFYGADPRCNQKDPDLYEYPVMLDGQKYPKNVKHGTTKTPARVVYLHQDGKTLCGVMTHVIENKSMHQGTGDFRVCDP